MQSEENKSSEQVTKQAQESIGKYLNSSGPGLTEETPQQVVSPSVHETPSAPTTDAVQEETKSKAANLLNQSVQNTRIDQLGQPQTQQPVQGAKPAAGAAAADQKQTKGKTEESKKKAASEESKLNKPAKDAGPNKPADPKKTKNPGLTEEQKAQIKTLKEQIEAKRAERLRKESIAQQIQDMLQLKQQLEKQSSELDEQVRIINEENTKKEQELVKLQVETRREELMKVLNTMKDTKKTEPLINETIKKQEKDIAAEVAAASNQEAQLQQECNQIRHQIENLIPEQTHKKQAETQMMKAQSLRLRREKQASKEKIDQTEVLKSKIFNLRKQLTNQVDPNVPNTIVEVKHINEYSNVVQEITERQNEIFPTLPNQFQVQFCSEAPPGYVPDPDDEFAFHDEEEKARPNKAMAGLAGFFKNPAAAQRNMSASNVQANMFSLFGNQLGDVTSAVKSQAKTASQKVQENRMKFMDRERQRRQFLENDKLDSMKAIMEYQNQVEQFGNWQREKLAEIEDHQAANALYRAVIQGCYADKADIQAITAQVDPEAEVELQEEGEIQEEGEVEGGFQEDYGEEQQDVEGAAPDDDGEYGEQQEVEAEYGAEGEQEYQADYGDEQQQELEAGQQDYYDEQEYNEGDEQMEEDGGNEGEYQENELDQVAEEENQYDENDQED